MKKRKTNKNFSVGLLIFAILAFGVIVYLIAVNSQKDKFSSGMYNQQDNTNRFTTYESKNLKFSIEVDKNFKIEDTGITVLLKNNDGEISIIRNGTQFSDLSSYLENSGNETSYKIEQMNVLTINNLNAVSRIEETRISRYKIYYIYVDNAVYNLSTTSGALFDDLDQIAESFRYTP